MAIPRIRIYLPRRDKVFTVERPLISFRSTSDAPEKEILCTLRTVKYKKRRGEHKVPRAFFQPVYGTMKVMDL